MEQARDGLRRRQVGLEPAQVRLRGQGGLADVGDGDLGLGERSGEVGSEHAALLAAAQDEDVHECVPPARREPAAGRTAGADAGMSQKGRVETSTLAPTDELAPGQAHRDSMWQVVVVPYVSERDTRWVAS